MHDTGSSFAFDCRLIHDILAEPAVALFSRHEFAKRHELLKGLQPIQTEQSMDVQPMNHSQQV